jgi:hypothetical protein
MVHLRICQSPSDHSAKELELVGVAKLSEEKYSTEGETSKLLRSNQIQLRRRRPEDLERLGQVANNILDVITSSE